MKLNINQWNTVLAVLHEEADKREMLKRYHDVSNIIDSLEAQEV